MADKTVWYDGYQMERCGNQFLVGRTVTRRVAELIKSGQGA